MNVLRTIETFLPYICGPANQAFQISNRLEERGIHSPVLTTYCDVPASLPSRDQIGRVRVIRMENQFQIMRYCVSLGMVKFLAAGGLKDFDVVHSHNYRNFQTDCGFFFAKLKGKPFVLNAHGSLLGFKKYLSPGLHQVPYKVYDGLTLKLPARRADAVVVSSKFEYEDAVEFGIDRKKLHIIPMGIDVAEESARPARPAPPSGSPLRILFVGRLARVRRVELLLQAAGKLKIPYQITIVGGEEKTASLSKGGYMRELKKLAADLGIADRATFTGPQKPEELQSCYENSDVFVYPSLYENFGQPLLEAASYGLPIIATKVGVARELVQDGETGFAVGDRPEEITDRLISLSDPAARSAMGRKIRELARKHFGWHNVIQRYIDIYRSI